MVGAEGGASLGAGALVWQQPAAIAWNTFRAAIRNRVLHAIVLASFALVLSSMAIGELSVDNDARVIRDIGTAFISLTVVVVAIFSGVSLLHVEIERKTIYTIVTKPVSRWMFIVGKFLGLVLTLFVVEALLVTILMAIILVRGDPVGMVLAQSFVLSFMEGMVIAAVATLFSSFSTPVSAGAITFGVFVVGRLRGAMYLYAERLDNPPLQKLVETVGIVVPDLTLARADLEVAYLIDLNWSYVGYSAGYYALYALVVIALACLIFMRRDFV